MKQFLTISQKAFKRMAYYKAQNLLSIFTALLGILMMQFFWRALYGENSVIPSGVRIGKNTAISGVTETADYPDKELASGGYIIKGGEA